MNTERSIVAVTMAVLIVLWFGLPSSGWSSGADMCQWEREEVDIFFSDIWHGGEDSPPDEDPQCFEGDCDWGELMNGQYVTDGHSDWEPGPIHEHGHEPQAGKTCGLG